MEKSVLLFGGSGFIGARLTKKLLAEGYHVCVVCTNLEKARMILERNTHLDIQAIDIFSVKAVQELVKSHDVVVNLIGKLFEKRVGDFQRFHQHFPELLAGVISDQQHFIHISALAVEQAAETSLYARTKWAGEQAVVAQAKHYHILKPSIVFGAEDRFFNFFANMARFSPFLPLVGGGKTLFAPVYLDDLTNAIFRLIKKNPSDKNRIFEAYGPDTASFKVLMQFLLHTIRRKRVLLTLPSSFAGMQARLLNHLGVYWLTPDQVELLKYDNVSSNQYPNIDQFVSKMQHYQVVVPQYLRA